MYAPTEKIPIIEVSNFPALGRLTALRFLEWVQQNPNGVVSLPTGKTPEYFIKWTQHFLDTWNDAGTQAELTEAGLDVSTKPNLSNLRFVQIDEFYPIDPNQQNSFFYYVNKHYIRGFGLDPKNALLINPAEIGIPEGMTLDTVFPGGKVDLGLRHRVPTTALERIQYEVILAVDQFCSEYEARIREWGGIGFFLGGIGPDGHIGFNARGSDLESPTRLTLTNYETEAAAAGDLGGIEVSRNRPVITIGLGTITFKRDAVVLVFAAGEAKGGVVADAIQNTKNVRYPASALQGLPNARFYLTHGATVRLTERIIEDIEKAPELSPAELDKRVINLCLKLNKRLDDLREEDAKECRIVTAALKKSGLKLKDVAATTKAGLLRKIESGLDNPKNQTLLHTGPHHDDIMLGYMNYILHTVRRPSNKNYFTVLTSGFTAVTSSFLATILEDLKMLTDRREYLEERNKGALRIDTENTAARAEEVYGFLDGIAARNEMEMKRWQCRRMLHSLMVVYEDEDIENIRDRIDELLNYLRTVYPGKKDIKIVQTLKGMQREFEEELIWGYIGTRPEDVFHGRLGFYTGDIFTRQPSQDRDVKPVLKMLTDIKPDIVTLAFDPEGTGPDTHYKVMQVLHEALIQYAAKTKKKPEVWGYRNVWHRFHPADANALVPMSLNSMAIMEHSFLNCFGSQKHASFPSFEYDGPFCHQAQLVFVDQYRMLRTCLGREFFEHSENPRLRAARGFVYLRKMALDEFSGNARALAEITEAV
ncbi:MAG: glucosamine-6-phosphate deaminase [Candidatus Sumerlaeota bacterium]|nr:glucosamine-6-phosphate deaminase [Candidatus Sumerlaeota bacterium]